jgi:glyoxylase I family protein
MTRRSAASLAATVAAGIITAVALAVPTGSGRQTPAPPQNVKPVAKRLHGPGLHHIAIKVADFDKSLRFYQEGIGMKKVFGWGTGDGRGAMLDMGDGNYFEVFAGGKPRTAEVDSPILHVALRSGDPDGAYKKAMDAGAKSQMRPTDMTIPGDHPLKIRISFVVGPDGEVVEFFKNDEF